MAERAAHWFGSLQDLELSVEQRLQVLVGLWLATPRGSCGLSYETDGRLEAAARAASGMLHSVEENPDDLADLDPVLVLCATAILRWLDRADPVLERCASRLATELLSAREPLDFETSVELAPARHLLAALGLGPETVPPTPQQLAAYCATKGPELLRVNETARARVASACLAASAFGHRTLWEGNDSVRLAVTTWAMAALQEYRLEQASQLLRTCGALCPKGNPSIAAGVEFLMMHQRTDGAFGFLGPECMKLSETRPDVRPELDVTLVITVAVVWCLAELLTVERLFPAPGADGRIRGSGRIVKESIAPFGLTRDEIIDLQPLISH